MNPGDDITQPQQTDPPQAEPPQLDDGVSPDPPPPASLQLPAAPDGSAAADCSLLGPGAVGGLSEGVGGCEGCSLNPQPPRPLSEVLSGGCEGCSPPPRPLSEMSSGDLRQFNRALRLDSRALTPGWGDLPDDDDFGDLPEDDDEDDGVGQVSKCTLEALGAQ